MIVSQIATNDFLGGGFPTGILKVPRGDLLPTKFDSRIVVKDNALSPKPTQSRTKSQYAD